MQDAPSDRVIQAVAQANGVDQTDLPPLYAAVDPDALDALVMGWEQGTTPGQSSLEVHFRYAGRNVVVRENGDIHLRESGSESGPGTPD